MSASKPGAPPTTAQRQDGSAEEQRLRAALRHLQAEAGVLERLVYKNRNQHRGAAYFQYIIKVRRDLKLLLGSNVAQVINAAFPVIACRKPTNTILVPNRQGKKKPGANHSHYKRLLGVARLLSQAFREYYPSNNDPSTILECVWVKDKFGLHERTKASCQKAHDEDHKSCAPDSSLQYETFGTVSEEMQNLVGSNSPAKQQHASLLDQPDNAIHSGNAGDPHSGRQLPDQNTTGSLLTHSLCLCLCVRLHSQR